jgi:hypothetical protein
VRERPEDVRADRAAEVGVKLGETLAANLFNDGFGLGHEASLRES